MLITQTSAGLARVHAEHYELLDAAGATLDDLIRTGGLDTVRSARTCGEVAVADTSLLPPVRRPGKFCIVGLNYADHAAEIGAELPRAVRFNYGAGSAVCGPHDDIVLPDIAPDEVDYEAELAIVIGRVAERVPVDRAWDHVAGVTAANDVSARDIQLGRGVSPGVNVGLGKGFDTFKPLGPALLTTDEVGPHDELSVATWVDGELRQNSSTKNLVFGPAELVATISRFTTLHPGDVILTGTPGGVALTTGAYLQEGQTVRVRLEHVGELRNRVVRRS